MKHQKASVLTLVLFALGAGLGAQTLYNNGATIYVGTSATTVLYVNGTLENASSGVLNNQGVIEVKGNFLNNAGNLGFVPTAGTLLLSGANQNIGGSSLTRFNNLTLGGTGIKTLQRDEELSGILDVGSVELATQSNKMSVLNTSPGAVVSGTGFVSSTQNGSLRWNTASTSLYNFPVGSSTGTTRKRPVYVKPNSGAAHTWGVRFANVDASTEGYNRSTLGPGICNVNPNFYHVVERISGASGSNLTFTFDNVLDAPYTHVAHWQNVPRWEDMGTGTLTSNSSPVLSSIQYSAWTDYTYPAFGFAGMASSMTVSANDTTICSGDTIQVTGAPGFSNYVYSRNQNVLTSGTMNMASVSGFSNGDTLRVTGTNAFGCTASAYLIVTVNPSPSVTITPSGPLTICTGQSVSLDAGSHSTYAWSPGTSTSQILNTGNPGTYYVTVSDGNGCLATSAPVTVTVNPPPATPTITASGSTSFCQGDSVILTSSAAGAYQWSPGGLTTQSITVTSSGNYTVTITQGGCSSVSAPTNVTILPSPPVPVISTNTGATSLCGGSSITLYTSASPTSVNVWNPGGIPGDSLVVSTAGTYTTTSSLGVCSATSAPITITTNPAPAVPVITPSGPTSFCNGLNVQLCGPNGYTYLWMPGGETTQCVTRFKTNTDSLRIYDANGCSAVSAPVTVTVTSGPQPVITPQGPTTFCQGDSVVLDAGPTWAHYSWQITNDTTSTTAAYVSGSYKVTVTDAQGCTGQSSPVQVTVNPAPSVTITPSGSTTLCQGDSVTLDAGSGFNSYAWLPGSQTTHSIVVTAAGSYSVTVSDANGCSGSAGPMVVTMQASPVSAWTFNASQLAVNFTDQSTGSPSSWAWTFGDGGTSSQQNPSHTYASAGTYTVCLEVTNAGGCKNKHCTSVTVSSVGNTVSVDAESLHAWPNPFSDAFMLNWDLKENTGLGLSVFDASGKRVYETRLEPSLKGETRIGMENLSAGIYNVVVSGATGSRVFRMEKQR